MNGRAHLYLLVFLAFCAPAGVWAQQVPMTVGDFKALLPEDSSTEIGLAEFKALQEEGEVVILDVRAPESFSRRHLAGSVNAPLTDLTETTLPAVAPEADVPVVLVCDYSFYPMRTIAMTMQAYPVLKEAGYDRIYRLNLWHTPGGGTLTPEEQAEQLTFEGTDVSK